MRRRWHAQAAVLTGAVVTLGGCSASPNNPASPKQVVTASTAPARCWRYLAARDWFERKADLSGFSLVDNDRMLGASPEFWGEIRLVGWIRDPTLVTTLGRWLDQGTFDPGGAIPDLSLRPLALEFADGSRGLVDFSAVSEGDTDASYVLFPMSGTIDLPPKAWSLWERAYDLKAFSTLEPWRPDTYAEARQRVAERPPPK